MNETLSVALCLKAVRKEYAGEFSAEDTYAINPYDVLALKKVIALKKQQPLHVTVFCMGPLSCVHLLHRCIAVGADKTYLLSDQKFAGSDTYATSYLLAKAIRHTGKYDLVICGEKAVDGETGQVSIGIAKRLNLPYLTNITALDSYEGKNMMLTRETDQCRESLRVQTPCLLVFKDFTVKQPQISLIHMKRAKNNPPCILTAEELEIDAVCVGQDGSKTRVVEVKNEIERTVGEVLLGSCDEQALQLNRLLREKGVLI